MILENISGPQDLKKLTIEELHTLADETRTVLLEKISSHGGHSGPNLGMVEMTVALHHVFDSPVDKIIFDVSHQTYIHKMLTGRQKAFIDPKHYDDVSGYTNPKESEHDLFTIGHTSTSLSLASGILHARDLKNEKSNVVAIIGDGALSGGMAYEGLNTIATLGTNVIIIINDNDQSIAKNPKGGIYTALERLRETKGQATNNIFKALGYDYHYLEDGNNLEEIISLFKEVKDIDHPVVLHIYTEKGKGFEPAERNHEKFHAGGPFSLETGEYIKKGTVSQTYNGITSEYLTRKLNEDPLAVVINAGTPGIVFNRKLREQLGSQFVDVGIAEEQAVTMTTGLAKNGAKPVWAVLSTFLQRTYDQLSHDMALNNQAGVVLVYSASINSMNDESHLGFFDIPLISHIPNFVYLAPTNKEEHLAMLEWAINQNEHPVAIRVPVGSVVETGKEDKTDYSILNKNKVEKFGEQVAIFGVGNFYNLAEEVSEQLKLEHNIEATLVNPRFLTGLDKELLNSLKENHKLVVTVEDGIVEGGYGQTVASYLGNTELKVQNYGISKKFYDRYNVEELMKENGLTVENIVKNIIESL
ncbi:1-deoxy-D-xylulose-5-phosphate synthase [uncultured Gemella sp.]|uniref:1-deoxy-D-xylulose-5-phosphate synthase n=1 Tax=uncultured Gemella sp. TaxID=254352 RepID=UPI0028E54293|nr:1-deoxy-D-xylulose-5-phosphate synthase [uncultured Gemella sp.]